MSRACRVFNKYIFEDLNQVREQTQIWMDDYNHKRPLDSLGKIPPVKYAMLNSFRAKNIENKKCYFRNLNSSI
ncbi:integrase core domain-containing protein [Algibacter sp. L3A6]|uniref:integrase core domain-containing protein n=1 Tax=Algibacter sp. L3A6 TaxID=2686366 RepID=UPI001E432C4A|nr:integrase core domain-containing protein [Algibacter sp. L3A6]